MREKNFFLHVGYAKAGSSLMGEWLAANPAFCFSDFSIGGFASTAELMDIALQDTAQPEYYVLRDMRFSVPRYEKEDFLVNGKIKEHQKGVCSLLNALFPSAKVLIVTRGYKSIISANYSQHVKEGGTLRAEDIFNYSGFVRDLFDYSYLIQLYRTAFGKENVIVLPYEFLKENPTAFFSKIEAELGLPHYPFTSKIVNPSLNAVEAKYLLKINSMVEFIARVGGSPGARFKNWYKLKRWKDAFKDTAENKSNVANGNQPLVHVPSELLSELSQNSYLLKEYAVFENYLSFY